MKILVTGGAGFIGSNVVDTYIEFGHEVVIVDNLSTGKKENINPSAKFIKADIRDKKLFDIIAPKYINRNGGYTRILKLGKRMADGVSLAIIEFV